MSKYIVIVDTLVLDSEGNFKTLVSETQQDLVSDNGSTTPYGMALTRQALAANLKSDIITESDCDIETNAKFSDLVYAFPAGAIMYGTSNIVDFLESKGLVAKVSDLKVSTPEARKMTAFNGFNTSMDISPVQDIVPTVINAAVAFLLLNYAWAKPFEMLLRAVAQVIININNTSKYSEDMQSEILKRFKSNV